MFFNSEEVEDLEFTPGIYAITCTDVEFGPNKNGTGTILKVEWQVGDSSYTINDYFNIEHQNPKAANIGKSKLKKVCEISGRPQLQQPSDLLGAQLRASVLLREYDGRSYPNIDKYLKEGETAEIKKEAGKKKSTSTAPNNATAEVANASDIPF